MAESFEMDFDFEDLEKEKKPGEFTEPEGGLEDLEIKLTPEKDPVGGPVRGQGISTYADIVFCIDLTGSMSPIIENVKKSAINFHDELVRYLGTKSRDVEQLRLKVIGFRDIYVDSKPFEESRFFLIPQELEEYKKFVMGLRATGGGDEPESGLEALVKAIKSDWTQEGLKKRHVIVVFTDASAHKLEKDVDARVPGMPKNLNEAEILWCAASQDADVKLDQQAKRLVLFAPNSYPWSDIVTDWDLAWHEICKGGEGLDDLTMNTIYNFLANSLS